MKWCTRLLVLASVFIPGSLHAMFMMPNPAPVDRLLHNTEAYLSRNPDKADAHYTHARIHYLAFVLQAEAVPILAMEPDRLPIVESHVSADESLTNARHARAEELTRAELGIKEGFPSEQRERERFFKTRTEHYNALLKEDWHPEKMPLEKSVEHVEKAVAAYRKAMELDPKNGLYALGLGSLLEQFASWKEDAKIDLPSGMTTASLDGDLHARARANFFTAWSLAYPEDAKAKFRDLGGSGGLSDFVSYEAGQAFLELALKNISQLPAKERAGIPQVRAAITKMEKLPHSGVVTPLILALEPHTHLDELLAPRRIVEFDLRGFGVAERWPWVKAEAGLLVWDPQDRREITSARQLFGSYTFQLFWHTGYDALRALDDNADGQLSGAELDGLSVWFDRNGDARSTRDEVTPLGELGIRALAVDAPALDGPHPTNSRGVTFTDGRTLPTWDWMATPIPSPTP